MNAEHMTSALATTNGTHAMQRQSGSAIIERVIALGDLKMLSPDERVRYYVATCESVGLNPLTKPFDYLALSGKLTLYATKNCTDQLRQLHGISVTALKREERDGLAIVYAHVRTKDGREDQDMGAVSVQGLKGESLANAMMKSTTKAKRRATLSICGLSMLDESELESVPTARRIQVDHATGEVINGGPQVAERDPEARAAYADAIEKAKDGHALKAIGASISKAKDAGYLSDADRLELSAAYEAKQKALKAKPKAEAPAAPPSEPKAVTPPTNAGDAWEPEQ